MIRIEDAMTSDDPEEEFGSAFIPGTTLIREGDDEDGVRRTTPLSCYDFICDVCGYQAPTLFSERLYRDRDAQDRVNDLLGESPSQLDGWWIGESAALLQTPITDLSPDTLSQQVADLVICPDCLASTGLMRFSANGTPMYSYGELGISNPNQNPQIHRRRAPGEAAVDLSQMPLL